MEPHEELLGADLVEHGIRRGGVGVSRALSALGNANSDIEAVNTTMGLNPGQYSCSLLSSTFLESKKQLTQN